MSAKTNSGLAHHTFSPWRVDGDRRIVAGENHWHALKVWQMHAESRLGFRPRVLVGVDVFEDWNGRIRSESGLPLEKSIIPGNKWFENMETYGPKDGAGLTMQDVRDRLFKLIDSTPNLDWPVFTRWPENIAGMLPRGEPFYEREGLDEIKFDGITYVPKNLWLGTDIDDQATADERIPHLLKVPAKVRMVRYSGVGKLCLWEWLYTIKFVHNGDGDTQEIPCKPPIDWLIISGEVGPDARPCNLEHVRDAIAQCKAAGVPVWVERLGANVRYVGDRDVLPGGIEQRLSLLDPHGADPAEWSEDLRVREVPTC